MSNPERDRLLQSLEKLRIALPTLSGPKLEQAAEAVEAADQILNRERIRWFVPNGGQQRFLDEMGRPGAFIVVNGSGNGGGKTYLLVAILAALQWPKIAPPCFGADIFRYWPYPKRLRIVSTPKEVEEIGSLQTTIDHLWPKGRYDAAKLGRSYPCQYRSDTGFVTDLMTYEQDKSEFAGPSLGLVAFNEPMPKDIWDECLMRLRSGGIAIAAMTSLRDNVWVADGLLNRADGDKIRVVFSDIEDNCIEHGKCGTLPHAQIERILGQYDPDDREARKTGKPLSLSGRIFKRFDRAIHVAKADIPPRTEGVTHYMVVDPAIGKPMACIWAQVDITGTIEVYAEHPADIEFQGARDSNLTVSDYVALIKQVELGRTVANRIIDRHFANVRRTLGGPTLKQEFAEVGMDFADSYNMDPAAEVETGILKVKEYLKLNTDKPIDSLNRPKLIISPHCRNTIAALEKWSRDPKTLKPKDDYKDFADCVRYLCMAEPEHEVNKSWPTNVRRPNHTVA